MSIAVAVRKNDEIVLATDSATSFGSLQLDTSNHAASKVITAGDVHIAGTGWSKYDNILRDYIERSRKKIDLTNEAGIFKFFHRLWTDLHEYYSFVNDQVEDKDTPFGDLDSSFLVVAEDGIFYVASDMSVTELKRFFAIGSGQDYALGACHTLIDSELTATEIATRAVEAACAFDVYCAGETALYRPVVSQPGVQS